MKNKTILTPILILILLAAAGTGSYALARLFPDFGPPAAPGLPPLSNLDLPPQTKNGFNVTVESYYADTTRLVFQVRLSGSDGFLDRVSLKHQNGEEINASIGVGSVDGNDPSLYQIEFNPVTPLTDPLKGKLDFAVVTSPGDGKPLAEFSFALDLPVHPALTFDPKQTIFANGLEVLLDRIVVTPAYTQVYLCYKKPTDADWMISGESSLKVGNQQINLNSYSLLFDSDFADGSKGGEPGWTPPVQVGRCVKIGFPTGDAKPTSFTLTISALEQSMPEVIPADELAVAYERLKTQGIDMEWHIVDHGAYPEYKNLPEGMSEQAAYRKFVEALGYMYKGSWIFDLQLGTQASFPPKFSTSIYGAATPLPPPSATPRIVATLPGEIRSFDISPDLKTIAFVTSKGVVLYDLKSYKHLRTLNEADGFYLVAWSPDGKKLAAGGFIMENFEVGRPHLVVWNTSAWQLIFEQTGIDEPWGAPYGDIAWSPDSHSLADTINGTGVLVHDIQTGKVVSKQDILEYWTANISWSPDGSRLVATGDMGYGIRRWRVDTDEFVRLYDQRGDAAIQVAWSPDGKRIASGHLNGTVCFWTAETNKCDGFIQEPQRYVGGLAWSPDGNQLATGGDIIRIWDSYTGKLVTAFGAQNDNSAYTPTYTHLVWPASDQPLVSLVALDSFGNEALMVVRFWDVDTGQILFEFHGASGSFGQ